MIQWFKDIFTSKKPKFEVRILNEVLDTIIEHQEELEMTVSTTREVMEKPGLFTHLGAKTKGKVWALNFGLHVFYYLIVDDKYVIVEIVVPKKLGDMYG